MTAPLGAGLHQEPHHYYGGFTPHWYRRFCAAAGLEVSEITANGHFFKLLAQECARVSWTMPEHGPLHGKYRGALDLLFGRVLPRYLADLDDKAGVREFTVGYHVEAIRRRPDEPAAAAG